jgi:hypothetical protein
MPSPRKPSAETSNSGLDSFQSPSRADEPARVPASPERAEHSALTQLRNHQRQLDQDGCMVGVSRQALDETLELVGDLHQALKGVVRVADRKTVEFDAARAALSKVEGK